ncbi:MAG: hypothetical protein CL946_13375, partial [Ectothiorhodospiraceae bacterium]|nr:hypothetical protein [Ectothiorhodospiraceae bacterium]
GEEWRWVGPGDGAYCAVYDENSFYVMAQYGYLTLASVNEDFDVVEIYDISLENDVLQSMSPASRYFRFVAPMVRDPKHKGFLYLATRSDIWFNTSADQEFGWDTWQRHNDTYTPASQGDISALSASPIVDARIYYGTNRGRVYQLDGANFVGAVPEELTGVNFPGANVNCVAPHPTDPDHLMVVFSNYEVPSLFVTTDGGSSWTDVSGNLEESPNGSGAGPSCRWADMIERDGQTVYFVGTSTGLYSTNNLDGANTVWTQEGENTIGNVVVSMIKIRQSDGFIAVGTHGNGVFTSSVTVPVEGVPAQPGSFFLAQNYPNPARTESTLRFHIADRSEFRITMHDQLGREIATLVEGNRQPGVYTERIALPEVAPGNYFIRMSAGTFAQTRMMTVVR